MRRSDEPPIPADRRYLVNRFEERITTAAKRSAALSGAWQKCRWWAPQQPSQAATLSGRMAISGQAQMTASGQIHLSADTKLWAFL